MNKYVKIFLAIGIPIGACFTFYFFFISDLSLILSVAIGAVIGTFVSGAVVLIIVGESASIGVGIEYGITSCSYVLELKATREETLALCRSSLAALGRRVNLKPSVEPESKINARVGWGFKSWGEAISMNLSPLSDAATRIEIFSKSALRTTLRDHGVNRANCEAIARFIEKKVGGERVIRSHHNEPKINSTK